jgi:hypothetical protein
MGSTKNIFVIKQQLIWGVLPNNKYRRNKQSYHCLLYQFNYTYLVTCRPLHFTNLSLIINVLRVWFFITIFERVLFFQEMISLSLSINSSATLSASCICLYLTIKPCFFDQVHIFIGFDWTCNICSSIHITASHANKVLLFFIHRRQVTPRLDNKSP